MAANLRSTCGAERGAPECSSQRSPTAAPHVGHVTPDICLGVSSFLFTHPKCIRTRLHVSSIMHIPDKKRFIALGA
jgi:hypothetical protein